tara:strand:- start:717 stop:1091 length:375 start_codon:yes stop_codon:yes gene_type:complete
MAWERKLTSRRKKSTKNHSISNVLRKQNKSNDKFEVMLNNLSLEEVIGLKLELANRAAGGYLYGLPIWHAISDIVRDAVLKFASTATKTKGEAARYLGLSIQQLNQANKRYKIKHYFIEDERLP